MKLNVQRVSVVAWLLLAMAACSGGGGGSGPATSMPDGADENVTMQPNSGNPSAPDNPPETDPVNPEPSDNVEAGVDDTPSQPAIMAPETDDPGVAPVPVITPPSVAALEDGGTLLSDFPALSFIDTLADSGLQIGYTQPGQQERTDTAFIEAQWDYMQGCLGVTGAPPLIVLVDGPVNPLTRDDDVLRFIDGAEIATASVSLSGTVIQLAEGDFDGTFGVPGFNLRQILGRSLWSAAGLPERDYPTTCARVISPEE